MNYPTDWKTYDGSVDWKVAKVCEMAAFHVTGAMVGKPLPYEPYSHDQKVLKKYNLVLKWRQVKAYKEPAPKKKDESTYGPVVTEFYALDGSLKERTVENRYVWQNSKGHYIKTRGSGRVFISDPETMTIRYEELVGPVRVWSSFTQNYHVEQKQGTYLVLPDGSKKRVRR